MSARFAITGERGGKFVTVTWTDGALSGDAEAVAALKRLAHALDGTLQGQLGGPYTLTDHLGSPYTACALMKRLFVRGTTDQEGKLPPLNIPPGAIA